MNITTRENVDYDVAERFLSWIDYTLFASTLCVSFIVGIYFGLWKHKAQTTDDYLLAGRTINVFPIGLSMIATVVSGTTLLAVPADIYKFGSNYVWAILADFVVYILVFYIFLPVYYKLRLISVFEYLELRFDKKTRRFVSILNVIAVLSYTPIVLYIPALAFSQVAGVGIYTVTITVSVTCIIYTTIGGFKAVIWTDALQFSVIIGSITAILFIGVDSVGGLDVVWNRVLQGHRMDIFDFKVNMTLRDSFWAAFVGNIFFNLSTTTVSQAFMQKLLALPSFACIKRCLLITVIGVTTIKLISLFTGNTVYAKYSGCDVFASNKITRTDQLIPYFVMDVTKNLPGLPGLFIAGIFSAALSSLSSSLNATAASIHKDLISPYLPENTTQLRKTNIIKGVVVTLGVISVLLVLIVEQVGGIFPFTTAMQAVSGGPVLGLFVLGLLFPMANAKGAFISGILGLILTVWLVFGNIWYKMQGLIHDEEKPVSIENCSFIGNITTTKIKTNEDDVFILYRIAFWYYVMLSTISTIIIGLIISFCTKDENVTINPEYISPVIHRWLPKNSDSSVYYSVDKASATVNSETKC